MIKSFTNCIVDFIKNQKIKDITLLASQLEVFNNRFLEDSKTNKKNFYLILMITTIFGEGISRGNLFAKFIMFHIGLPFVGNFF